MIVKLKKFLNYTPRILPWLVGRHSYYKNAK